MTPRTLPPATWAGLMTKPGLKLWSDDVKTGAFLCSWAWWAMAHWVAEGRARLKWLSMHCGSVFILRCVFTWSRKWHPTPVLLSGKSHGKRSLVGCSPWGRKESDTTERLHFHLSLSCIEKEMATHSSVFACRIPGTEELGGLLSMGSHRVGHDWSDLAAAVFLLNSGYSYNKGVTLFKWNGWNGWRMAIGWLKTKWLKNGWLKERRLGWCFSWPTPTCISECILGKMNSSVRKSQHF